MKYKTLIEKNSEPNLTEGRLTTPPPPPHPRFASTTLLPPQFPLPPIHPTKVHLRWPRRSRGAWKKRMRREYKHVVPKHVSERAVVLLLLVLFQLLHGKFRTCRIVTFIHFSHRSSANKAFSFFCVQSIIPMPMTRKLSELSPMRRLKRIATFGSIIWPKLTRKEKPRRWVTLKIEGFTEKAQTKLLVHRV